MPRRIDIHQRHVVVRAVAAMAVLFVVVTTAACSLR